MSTTWITYETQFLVKNTPSSPYLFVFTCKVQPNPMNLFARVAIWARWTPISGTSIVTRNTNIFGTRISFITLKRKINKYHVVFSLVRYKVTFKLENSLRATRYSVKSSPSNQYLKHVPKGTLSSQMPRLLPGENVLRTKSDVHKQTLLLAYFEVKLVPELASSYIVTRPMCLINVRISSLPRQRRYS